MTGRTRYEEIEPFVTKDGSIIRELMRGSGQSLAEAIVPPGEATSRHRHPRSEEFYHITAGEGLMRLGEDEFAVKRGDTVNIPPGAPHSIANTGEGDLKILCACSPAYTHEDTEIL
jgi:mannose-6-phosphate isomerase-like protein (cupin superfamily)